ncbi:MAG: hypothetical protein ACRDL7_13625, partial [Gaiellaceae bacterium]
MGFGKKKQASLDLQAVMHQDTLQLEARKVTLEERKYGAQAAGSRINDQAEASLLAAQTEEIRLKNKISEEK